MEEIFQQNNKSEPDFILGRAVYVLDYNEFNLRVTYFGPENKSTYKPNETILIKSFVSYADGIILENIKTVSHLEKAIYNLAIKCLVDKRDHLGRLVSDVFVVG
ncbi:MAG: hypothetical protein K8F36_09130 [Melioribacteraceae bacterium]|nr:hypothetical protein [Melioribacteraceae bacterium]MCO6472595.1 hypothetical protein [Melioribacteraceae bacterium]